MKHALLFLERNMGSGYAYAYPPTNPILKLWCKWCLHQAKKTLERDGHPASLGGDGASSKLPAKGTVSMFMNCRFVVYSLLVHYPDPRERTRKTKFTLHCVFPRNLNFISGSFQAFLAKCRSIGWNTLQSGQMESLRIPIPDNLFLKKH